MLFHTVSFYFARTLFHIGSFRFISPAKRLDRTGNAFKRDSIELEAEPFCILIIFSDGFVVTYFWRRSNGNEQDLLYTFFASRAALPRSFNFPSRFRPRCTIKLAFFFTTALKSFANDSFIHFQLNFQGNGIIWPRERNLRV